MPRLHNVPFQQDPFWQKVYHIERDEIGRRLRGFDPDLTRPWRLPTAANLAPRGLCLWESQRAQHAPHA